MDRKEEKKVTTRLVIGLGNPGSEYADTRHNAGASLVDLIARTADTQLKKHKTNALVAKITLGNSSIILARPLSYMNESGTAILALKRFFKLPISDIIIVYDDIDLPFGKLRISTNASSGGHRGIQSILDVLHSHSFPRIRIGIGPQKGKAEHYVLEKWGGAQKKELPKILSQASQALVSLIRDGMTKAANDFN